MIQGEQCWPSIDTHFQDGAGSISVRLFSIKVASTSFKTFCNLLPPWLHKIHDQQSLTLCWHSFWRWGREGIAICVSYKGGQIFLYDCLQPIGGLSTQDARLKIIDASFTLISIHCIVNICCHRSLYKCLFWLTGCNSVWLGMIPLAKPSRGLFLEMTS